MQPLSLQVLVVTLDGQAKEGVEGVAFNVECCDTGGCCYSHSTVEEKSQAVNQVGLSSPCCP